MNIKRISAAAAAVCVSLSLTLPGAAAGTPALESEAIQTVKALGIMVGDADGNMNLPAPVTRAEFITMALKATPGGEQIGQAASSPYPDVPRGHWASGYVEAGVSRGLISGYTDGTFRPSNQISLAEGASIVLRLLGYGAEDFPGAYPTGQLAMYHSLRLDRNVSVSEANAPLARRDAMYLFYNLMTAKGKDGTAYLTTLGYSLNAAGEIDLLSLLNDSMDGPLVAGADWRQELPFDAADAAVYRNGVLAGPDSVQEYDVIYWNQSMAALWVYSDKVTGAIQALEPSTSSPSSVTVAGRTFGLETSAAVYALSDLGEYRLGDTVTLLLGRDGGVAAVARGADAADSQRMGVVTQVTGSRYPDGKGGSYTAKTVTLLSTDGQTYRYPSADNAVKAGDLMRVMTDRDGAVVLRRLPASGLTGRVDGRGQRLDRYRFASDVEILDVSDACGVRVYPARLAGLELGRGAVRYYSLNADGEIDRLILNDVTGDMHQYGLLLRIDAMPVNEVSSLYAYALDIGGQSAMIPQTSSRYPVECGPVRVTGTLEAPEKLQNLTSAQTGEVSGSQFVTDDRTYTLSDRVTVYEQRGKTYYLSSLAHVQAKGYTLTGWFDKAENLGGRIRVLIAR